MTPYVHQLKTNFTTYEVATLMKIEKAHSYRLYELLKKEIYRSDPNINNGIVTKEYGLSELKCTIGLANTDEEGVRRAIADARAQGRRGLVLTCKDKLIHYYAKFGFENEGVSESTHGNVVWNQMRLTF